MDYRTYHNCLRQQITIDDLQDERIDALVSHCVEYGFDNVMLMLNLEEFHRGNILIAEAREWVEVLKKAKKKLVENGISVSVNNWIEMGHADRGRHFYPGQNFTPMMDIDGRASTVISCPLCKNWRAYFSEYITLLVRELEPDTYWIEDDFRLMNHAPLRSVGCYCDLHMAHYNERLGTNYTREEFIAKLLTPGECTPERKVWLDVNRDVMVDLADEIARTVKAACPQTDVAIMTSSPEQHCIEARDWDAMFAVLGRGGHKINRIHLPYEERVGKEYLNYFNKCSMGIRAMLADDVIVMPEIECSSSSRYRRSPRFLRFALDAAIPLVLSGMTYSLYDFVANGPRPSFGYGDVVREQQPYMQSVLDLGLRYATLAGVVVPIDPRICYTREMRGARLESLMPTEYHAAGYLAGMGITFRYSLEKAFVGQIVFMTESSADTFSNEELRDLFANNFVLLDGGCALLLKKRGLLSLIGATNAENKGRDNGYHTYEECHDHDLYIDGVRGLRMSCRTAAGAFVEITYEKDVDVKTDVYGYYMNRLAPAMVCGEKFAVIPYIFDAYLLTQFCTLRRHFLHETVIAQNAPVAICREEGVCPYLYLDGNRCTLILTNGNVDTFVEFAVKFKNVSFNKVYRITRDGKTVPVDFTREGDTVIFHAEIEYLSTSVLVLV